MSVDLEQFLRDRAITPSRPLDIAATRTAAVRLRRTRHSTGAALALLLVVVAWMGPLQVGHSAAPLISELPAIEPTPPAPAREARDASTPAIIEAVETPTTAVPMEHAAGLVITADGAGDDPAGESAPDAADTPTAVAAWTFDDGIEPGWSDRKDGQTDAGFRYGDEGISTGPSDPRRSWAPHADGRNGTAGVRARRLDSAAETNSAYMISPDFVFASRPAEIEVSLWYRWDGAGDDTVDLVLLDGIGVEVPMATLTRSSAPSGTWTHLVVTLRPTTEEVGSSDVINVGLRTTFRAPSPSAACTGDATSTGTECDLGFTLDDLQVSVR